MKEGLVLDILSHPKDYPYSAEVYAHFLESSKALRNLSKEQVAVLRYCDWLMRYYKESVEGFAYSYINKLNSK